MVKVHDVDGYEAYKNTLEKIEKSGSENSILILFGASWCSDCQKAEPVLHSVLKKLEDRDDIDYIHVSVGERSSWKSSECVFRTDPKLKLTSIPTLIRWGTGKRLQEDECADETLVELLFEEE